MTEEERQSGIPAIGSMRWGTHFCYFYETTQDLLDILVPFFKAGLESNELCLWIVPNEQEARVALLKAFPGAARHLSAGNIEIIAFSNWCIMEGEFDAQRLIAGLKRKLDQALASGYAGMRVNGNEAWLTEQYRQDFANYEKQLNDMIANEHMIVLCAYPLPQSKGSEIFEIAQTHQFVIAKRYGNWEAIESPELRQSKKDLQTLSAELEVRIADRTQALEEANSRLRRISASLEVAREEEGNRISREIHDQIGSALTALRWDLDEVQRSISDTTGPHESSVVRDRLSTMQQTTDNMIETVRRIAAEIRPSILDDLGLIDALEWQASDFQRRTAIECRVDLPRENLPINAEQSMAVFRIVQEALTNVTRHASATLVSISIKSSGGNFLLSVRDNGKGIPRSKLNFGSLGIWSMQERVRLAGGTFDIVSVEGRGTAITVQIPGKDT